MDANTLTILMLASLFSLFAIGCPIGFSMFIVAVFFELLIGGFSHIYMLASSSYGALDSLVLIAVPLFIFMGSIMVNSGMAESIFKSIYVWAGPLRGSLAMGTVIIASLFSAFSGSSSAMTITIGKIALPEMLKHKYSKELALGTICVAGVIDLLIPPSVLAIIFCGMAGLPVGKMYLAMFIPGFLLAAMYLVYIGVRCYLQPDYAPAVPSTDSISWHEKLVSLKSVLAPVLVVAAVLGGIYTGIVTATEAAAVGAFSMIIVAALDRSLNWSMFKKGTRETLSLTSTVAWILIGVTLFNNVYNASGGTQLVQNWIMEIPGGAWSVIIFMQISWLILGCVMDDIAIMTLCIPIYMPIIKSLGFDPIWFSVLFMVNMQVSWLTPPYGLSLFYVKAITPPGITMIDIYRGVVPFICIQLIVLGLVMVFPLLALWLPTVIMSR